MNSKMLEGVRITDLSTVIFGPYCTATLADLGADVVKVEPPGGDTIRLVGTPAKTPKMGPGHIRLNRGKRSVCWDMKTDLGRQAMRKLIETSDVFLHNIRPDAIARIGLSYDDVKAIRPDIIYVHCTGFNTAGPYAGLQAYDDIIQASTGMATLLPQVDGNPAPRYFPMAVADKVSGLHAVYAVLAALFHRQRTGEGQRVEVPMFESVANFTMVEHLADITFVPPSGTSLYKRQIDPLRQPFQTRDGYISIAPYLENRWARLFAAIGRDDVVRDQELSFEGMTAPKDMDALNILLREVTPSRTTGEWLDICKQAAVPAMRVNRVDDLLTDPHLQAVGMFRQRRHPTEGEYLDVQPPVQFSARPYPDTRPAPHIGEHTDELLRELGLADRK